MIGLVLMICAKSRDKGPNHRPHPWIIYLAQYLSTRAMWGWGGMEKAPWTHGTTRTVRASTQLFSFI
jgi:hypothetical protein